VGQLVAELEIFKGKEANLDSKKNVLFLFLRCWVHRKVCHPLFLREILSSRPCIEKDLARCAAKHNNMKRLDRFANRLSDCVNQGSGVRSRWSTPRSYVSPLTSWYINDLQTEALMGARRVRK